MVTSAALRARAVLTGLVLLALPRPAAAEEASSANDAASPPQAEAPAAEDTTPRPTAGERALATAGAVVPGAVVHGAGHYVAGEGKTATRLLIGEGIGVALLGGGLVAVAATGASKYVTGPAAATMVLGAGLFGTSYLADIYGSASPDADAAARRVRPPPWIETELGYRHVSDPVFEYEHFVVERVSLELGRMRLAPSAWFSTDGDNARYRLDTGYRILGPLPSPDERPMMNDRLDGVLALAHHRFATEHFTRTSLDLALDGRLDLAHLGPTLRGAFVEGALGYAFGRIDYNLVSTDVPADFDDLLLVGFAFGTIFRGLSHPGSEWRVYYDHRHDDFAGGLILEGIPSGIAGHFGLDARWFFTREVGFGVHAEVGSAYVAGASILFRQGGTGPVGEERRSE